MRKRLFLAIVLCPIFVLSPDLRAQVDRHLRIASDPVLFDTTCGAVQCRDVLFENISARPLRILSATIPQTPFSLAPGPVFRAPLTLSPGEIATARYCFAPTIPDLGSARNNLVLTVDTGDAANPARDTLVLDAVARSASLVIDPPELNVGGIIVGTQTCGRVTIRNDGNAPLPLVEILPLNAPYSINPPIAGALAPGASATLEICFAPASVGRFQDMLVLGNGSCRTPVRLAVNGAGMDVAPDIGPILQLSPRAIDFGAVRCGDTICRDITLRNVGSSVTTFTSADAVLPPFTGAFPVTPFSLAPDSSITLRFCYVPPDAPRLDTQQVAFIADSRYPLTIATVFDVSRSMDEFFGMPAIRKVTGAHDAGRNFLANLIHDTLRGLVDTGAVYRFAGPGEMRRLEGYSTDRIALRDAVPNVANGSGTCIYLSIVDVSAELRLENVPGRRVIVILTDGENSRCGGSAAQAIAAAQAAGVRVYTIGIGNPGDVNDTELTAIALQTNGRYFFASDVNALVSVYRTISEDLSKSAAGYITLQGEGAAPLLQLDPPLLSFDSVRVDSSRCLDVSVRNAGNALYPGGPLEGIDAPFATATPIVPPLLPGESATIEICFGPDRLRLRRDTLALSYSGCAEDTLVAAVEGVGYDSVVVELRDVYTGRPGSIVEIPIHLLDPLPEIYAVDSVKASVRFNKTMLAPADDFIVTEGTASQGALGTIESIEYSGDTAKIDLLLSGGRILVNAPTSELARLRFLVLLGNAMETPIEAYAARFADGNPKVGRRNPAIFRIDSLCYLPERLLDASGRYGGAIKSASTIGGRLVVGYQTVLTPEAAAVQVTLDLYDMNGEHVMALDRREIAGTGTTEITCDAVAPPPGVYLIHLTVGSVSHSTLGIVGGGE